MSCVSLVSGHASQLHIFYYIMVCLTYITACLNCHDWRPSGAFVSTRLANVNVYMVSGFGTLALEGVHFLLAFPAS